MIHYNLKSLDNLNKVKTVECDTSVIQSPSSLVLSSNKLFFFKINLTVVRWSSSWLENVSFEDSS